MKKKKIRTTSRNIDVNADIPVLNLSTPKKTEQKKNIKKVHVIIGSIMIIAGLAGLSFPFWFVNAQNNIGSELYQKSEILKDAAGENTDNATPAPDYELISVENRLSIPGTGINMAVIKSDNAGVLSKAAWMFPGNSSPENGGNTVIFGHRFRYLPPISNTLYHLDKVSIGDDFTIFWNGKQYSYRVSETKIIEPDDLSVIQPTADSRVTIITCAPLFSTKQRMVVVGTLLEN